MRDTSPVVFTSAAPSPPVPETAAVSGRSSVTFILISPARCVCSRSPTGVCVRSDNRLSMRSTSISSMRSTSTSSMRSTSTPSICSPTLVSAEWLAVVSACRSMYSRSASRNTSLFEVSNASSRETRSSSARNVSLLMRSHNESRCAPISIFGRCLTPHRHGLVLTARPRVCGQSSSQSTVTEWLSSTGLTPISSRDAGRCVSRPRPEL